MSEELKPCRFCSGRDIAFPVARPSFGSCLECGARGPCADKPSEAIAAWNRRADWAPETRHERDCAYVTSDGPAPCTCKASRALLSSLHAKGLAVVPVEPTKAMIISALQADTRLFDGQTPVEAIWTAMLAASQEKDDE